MIHLLTILGAAQSDTAEGVSGIALVGFCFVLVVLAVLAAIASVMGMVFARRAASDALKAGRERTTLIEAGQACAGSRCDASYCRGSSRGR